MFKKKYGQNFLIDCSILDKMIEASEVTKDDLVIEIGPGIGALTQSLAQAAKHVAAIEIDKELIPVLKKTLKEYDNVEVFNEDILKADIKGIINKYEHKGVKVIANLPYYITTPIIMMLLENEYPIDNIIVMVQKEVAQRIQAKPNTKEFGAVTLAVSYYCEVSLITNAASNCFIPKPNVDSSVIGLRVMNEPLVKVSDKLLMFKIIKAAFGQRRKTLVNCLFNSGLFNFSKQELANCVQQCGFNKNIRGEALDIISFAKLADYLKNNKKGII